MLHIFLKKKHILFICFFVFLPESQAQLDLSFGYSSYLTHTDLEGQFNHYVDLGLDFKSYKDFDSWSYGAEVTSLFFLDESNQHYLSVPDLFVAYYLPNIVGDYNFSFALGNQKKLYSKGVQKKSETGQTSTESWSFMDEIWGLGLWQGRINWDYFQSKQKGLVGSFFTIEKGKWLFTLFLSGLFFPDQEPYVDINKGDIQSRSRWFISPQSNFVIFSQRFEALYWLQKPYLKNVILNDSLAVRLRFGSQDSDWFSLAYAYKPINQTYFKIDGGFSIDKKAVNSIIQYQSFKHSLISMDFGLKRDFFKTVFSVIHEVPRRPKVPEDWIVPVLPQALFFSSHFELNFEKYFFPIQLIRFNFIYSQFVNPKNTELEKDNQISLDLNVNRFKLYHGFALSAYSRQFTWKSQSFLVGVSYWHSIPEKGDWLNASFKWHFTSHFSLESDINILGVGNTKKQGFFNSYKHNDRVRVKVVYEIN